MAITLADVSEFQDNVDADAYLAAGHSCLIVRAHNGWRPDNKWPGRRDYVRKHPFVAVGYYQYLVSERAASDQARDFITAVGDIRPNEFLILDLEEGGGAQVARAQTWFAIVDAHYGRTSTIYSGEAFFKNQLGGAEHWQRPRWMAAYRATEPTAPHELWQNTDSAPFPGIGLCDGNIFHGTAQNFATTFCGRALPYPPSPHPEVEDLMICAVVKQNGAIELFLEKEDGRVFHTWQTAPNSGWWGAEKGKQTAGWQNMNAPK